MPKFTDKPWDGSASRWPDADSFCSCCLIDLNPPGEEKSKSKCKLPVREPSGEYNRNALRNASARLSQTDAPAADLKEARSKLDRLMDQAGINRAEKSIPILKADAAKHLVYGVVLEPETVDLQGDIISAEEIEQAAHRFMMDYRQMGEGHERPADASVVESYIVPTDMVLEGQTIKIGSWILVTKVHNVDLWDKIVSGELKSYSIGGRANSEETD